MLRCGRFLCLPLHETGSILSENAENHRHDSEIRASRSGQSRRSPAEHKSLSAFFPPNAESAILFRCENCCRRQRSISMKTPRKCRASSGWTESTSKVLLKSEKPGLCLNVYQKTRRQYIFINARASKSGTRDLMKPPWRKVMSWSGGRNRNFRSSCLWNARKSPAPASAAGVLMHIAFKRRLVFSRFPV